jgi:hypothetical protein
MGSREVDMNNERCSFEEDEIEVTDIYGNVISQTQKLAPTGAITEIILNRIEEINTRKNEYSLWYAFMIAILESILPQVKALEEEQQKRFEKFDRLFEIEELLLKAKEEERERTIQQVVGILEEMVEIEYWRDYNEVPLRTLKEAITRITN